MARKLLKSKTMWFAFLLATFSVVESQIAVFGELFGPKYFGYFTLGVSMIVAWLRFVTTQPLDDK